MMHLAINGYFWNRVETGSGQYTRALVYQLNRLVSDLEISLIYPQAPGDAGPAAVPPSVKVRLVPLRPGNLGKVIFEQYTFPRACRAVGATVAHVPYWGSPVSPTVPTLVTVHDLTTLLVREYRRGPAARLYTGLVSAGARAAAHVLTDSFASKLDIVDHLGLKEEIVTAIYLAAAPEYNSRGELLLDMAIAEKYELPDFYVLYLGGYALHKNVTTLLLAYSYVGPAIGAEYPLLLAGRKPAAVSANFPDYDDYIRRLGIGDYVRWLGFVDEADKPAIYRGASSFAFPSRYEGFGLPPLEAMACGVPVVTTNSSSLPEVVGDAAYTVDPDDARGLAGAIIATVIQDNLANDLKQRGLAQAKRFSWETTATETLREYARVSL